MQAIIALLYLVTFCKGQGSFYDGFSPMGPGPGFGDAPFFDRFGGGSSFGSPFAPDMRGYSAAAPFTSFSGASPPSMMSPARSFDGYTYPDRRFTDASSGPASSATGFGRFAGSTARSFGGGVETSRPSTPSFPGTSTFSGDVTGRGGYGSFTTPFRPPFSPFGSFGGSSPLNYRRDSGRFDDSYSDRLDNRFDRMSDRFDSMYDGTGRSYDRSDRFDNMNDRFDNRFDRFSDRYENRRDDRWDNRGNRFDYSFDRVKEQVGDRIKNRWDRFSDRRDDRPNFRGGRSDGFLENMGDRIDNIRDRAGDIRERRSDRFENRFERMTGSFDNRKDRFERRNDRFDSFTDRISDRFDDSRGGWYSKR